MYAAAGIPIASTTMPAVAHHGNQISRISPRTIPTIDHFTCGVMMTPSIRAVTQPLSAYLRSKLSMQISMPVDAEANELLTRSPLALLVAMLLDQQVPLERAFSAPLDLVRRLGHEPTAAELAEFDPEALAARVQDLARLLMEQYDGDAARLWETAGSGAELLKRVAALPGFGAQKAQIFVALLGKQLGVRPPGWREAAG